MATCAVCGKTILFGGVQEGEFRFCNQSCSQRGAVLHVAAGLPVDLVHETIQKVHRGNCPLCQGPGPVDIHTSHQVWSILVLTSWKTNRQFSCRPCGVKSQLRGLAVSALLGWWGFPFGLIMTPIQIARNLAGLFHGPDHSAPSPDLEKMVRLELAKRAISQGPPAH